MSGISRTFFKIETGSKVRSGGRTYEVTHLVSVSRAVCRDLESGKSESIRIDDLEAIDEPVEASNTAARDLEAYSPQEWQEAQRRFAMIKPLLEVPVRTRTQVDDLARRSGVHAATLYKWLKQYHGEGHVLALVPEKRGRKNGTKLLRQEQEQIISAAIEDLYLSRQRHRPSHVVEDVMRRCRLAKIDCPHPNTVRKRLAGVDRAVLLRRRGQRDIARNLYEPVRGPFPGADHPFSVVQIDHTPMDIEVVDEHTRQAIGRPWLTLAFDVYSRMVAGLYLSFDPPSSTAVGMCLSHVMCTKGEYLAQLEVRGDWPVWGLMASVHTDNGKEFRGNVLKKACEKYGIDLQWRPVRLPNWGGHIERMLGTLNREIHNLPGTTFSNPTQRRGYDSGKASALTLRELECWLVDHIVNVYHQKVHSELKMPPRKMWEIGICGSETQRGIGVLPVPADPERIRIDFLPFFERSVQQYGIQIDNISYYDRVLDPFINAADPKNPKAKRKFTVRRDPRDISKIYFYDPTDDRYSTIGYGNIGHLAITAEENRRAQRLLAEEGRKDVDEKAIFETIERLRTRVEAAKEKTRAVRRELARRPSPAKPTEVPARREPELAPAAAADDLFSQPVVPFDNLEVRRA